MVKELKTLSSIFEPPEGFIGSNSVLCGFSGEEQFLNYALERFTRSTSNSRLARASLDLTLMLDSKHEEISRFKVPGIIQLRPRSNPGKTWSKMHAKVALLGFSQARSEDPELYRIVVSTGNWTKSSSMRNLELIWCIDIDPKKSSNEDLYELYAVVKFFINLKEFYQTGKTRGQRLDKLLNKSLNDAKEPTNYNLLRFLSTLNFDGKFNEGLVYQIARKMKKHLQGGNYLVCGSGFYEQAKSHDEKPEILSIIETEFRKNDVLTKNSTQKYLVSNFSMLDQVTKSIMSGKLNDWNLHIPKDPSDKGGRSLHAKFIFAGKMRGDQFSTSCLYLGSGNLSLRGAKLSPLIGGNIEAGVVISTPDIGTVNKLKNEIPFGKEYKISFEELEKLTEKEEDEEPDLPVCPIIGFLKQDDGSFMIDWDSSINGILKISLLISPDDVRQIKFGENQILIQGNEPQFIKVMWIDSEKNEFELDVPCFMEHGEFKRVETKPEGFDDWLDRLKSFPKSWNDPADDDDEDILHEDSNSNSSSNSKYKRGNEIGGREFPAHTAMKLVETIADINGQIKESQASDWLASLKHNLINDLPKEVIESWRTLEVNFMAALLSRNGFAPDWTNLRKYTKVINEVCHIWKIDKYENLEP